MDLSSCPCYILLLSIFLQVGRSVYTLKLTWVSAFPCGAGVLWGSVPLRPRLQAVLSSIVGRVRGSVGIACQDGEAQATAAHIDLGIQTDPDSQAEILDYFGMFHNGFWFEGMGNHRSGQKWRWPVRALNIKWLDIRQVRLLRTSDCKTCVSCPLHSPVMFVVTPLHHPQLMLQTPLISHGTGHGMCCRFWLWRRNFCDLVCNTGPELH